MWGAVDIKQQNELFASVHFILNAECIFTFFPTYVLHVVFSVLKITLQLISCDIKSYSSYKKSSCT